MSSGTVRYTNRPGKLAYGVVPGRRLASIYGSSQSMAPMSSIRPNGAGFQAINGDLAHPADALARVLQNGQDTFAKIAPVGPASSPTVPRVSTAPSASFQGTDLSADPILNQIKDIGRRGVSDAATAGLAGAKNDLINYGSLEVPQTLKDLFGAQTPTNDSLLGDLPGNPVLAALNDAGTGQAATGNPFSVTRQLANAHDTNDHNIDQATNASNLFYSSTHANQLGAENSAYLGSQNNALQALAQALSGDNTGLLSALNSAHDQYVNELPNAYARAIAAGGSGATGDPTSGGAGGTTITDTGAAGGDNRGGSLDQILAFVNALRGTRAGVRFGGPQGV